MTAREVLDGIKGRLTKATPGPWKWGGTSVRKDLYGMHGRGILRCSALLHPDVANAEFIAAAPVDVARLTRAIEDVLGVVDTYPYSVMARDVRAAIEDALNPKEGQ